MQNKGLVRTLAVCLVLVCAFYLSFSVVTGIQNRKAKEYAEANATSENVYFDSIATQKIWFGYTLKECREKEINLGLDLKGGMNVTMEVSVPEILDALSGHSSDTIYTKAMAAAREKQKSSGDHFVTLFVNAYKEIGGEGVQLSPVFAYSLQNKLNGDNSNENIEKVLRSEVDDAIQNSFNVLRTRIDRFGVVQPNIQQLAQPGRILIELPGVKEPERVRKLLQGSANLEFWETYEAAELMPKLMQINREFAAAAPQEEEAAPAEAEAAPAEEVKAEEAPAVEGNDELAALVETLSADSVAPASDDAALRAEYKKRNPLFGILNPMITASGQTLRGPIVGTVHYVDTATVNEMLASQTARAILPHDVRFCWTVKPDSTGSYFQLIALKAKSGHASLEGDVVTDARAEFSQFNSNAEVSMTMTTEGAKAWQRITKDNIGKSVAIVLDGYVYSFPTVQNEISGGRSQITGNFTVDEAKDLANTLKSGKMPAPARIIEESVVGPSLGRESIEAGLWSFVLGFVLILIYMLFYYGVIPGLIADFALLCNIFLLVGILASFNAVLTLPGIAGIVLTMGMAVDANVLIYERIREELRLGKGMRKAVEDGFKGAISAIVDANVTSFLTGAILAIFGTGPIKGFAVTYMIGIISSFLTAVFITRLLLDDYCKRENAKELSFTTALMKNFLQNIHFDFVKARKVAYCISGAVIIFALLGLEPHIFGKLNLGIDFTGGRNYVVRFDKNLTDSLAASNKDFSLRQEVYDNLAQVINPQDYSLSVITYGNEANQVRISTNYLTDEQTAEADEAVDSLLFVGCKPFLTQEFLQDEELARHQFSNTEAQIGIISSQKVGPSIADDIKTHAVWAVLAALVVIFLYILVRFRNFAYSVGAIAALAHDTVIILGLYAILCQIMPFSMEIDQAFIAAILTVIGYSINDTVVIFDRVREYNTLYLKREKKVNINDALNNTLSRTFSTSMSTFVVLLAIFVFGGETIRGFVFALLMGVIVGTYSSLFIASPIAYDIQQALAKRAEKKEALKK
ncbi:MAG: protein translocase subunit SecDF [Paludibacteraceae bacterium]|nr:protein translocase subunit SecDF [Paludibacteraceae bacterium]